MPPSDTEIRAAHDRLLAETRRLIARVAPLAAMAGGALARPLAWQPRAPRAHVATRLLAPMGPAADGPTAPLVRALVEATAHLHWRNSYAPDQVGQGFLDRSAWVELVSPGGPFLCETHRVTIGFWDRGLHYPRHWHRPEEVYCVLAGSARFETDGRADERLRAGGTRHHAPSLPHAATMDETPLLALAIWRGEGLTEISTLCPVDDA